MMAKGELCKKSATAYWVEIFEQYTLEDLPFIVAFLALKCSLYVYLTLNGHNGRLCKPHEPLLKCLYDCYESFCKAGIHYVVLALLYIILFLFLNLLIQLWLCILYSTALHVSSTLYSYTSVLHTVRMVRQGFSQSTVSR